MSIGNDQISRLIELAGSELSRISDICEIIIVAMGTHIKTKSRGNLRALKEKFGRVQYMGVEQELPI